MRPIAPPRLLFLLLAHDRPEDAASLARTLVAAASDSDCIIHFDANAPAARFEALRASLGDAPRIHLADSRARCRWGGFGLVEAVLIMLATAERLGVEADHVTLLSGACLPCRPIAALERFLAANRDREFIEIGGQEWILDGLRAERHTLYHWVDATRWRALEKKVVLLQRLLGVRRRFPKDLTPRFGAQWWTMTGRSCAEILALSRARPDAMRFFRSVWIPDEMVIQTLADAVIAPEARAGFCLTHFQFTDKGKPVVFYDDHADYALGLERFFFRKAAPEAAGLRARALATAAAEDDGRPGPARLSNRLDYEVKTRAQTAFPRAGQIFALDQLDGADETLLARCEGDYVVVVGPRDAAAAVLEALPAERFERLGAPFDPDGVELGPGRSAFRGLRVEDGAIRDLHPALFLARLRARCARIPAFRWSVGAPAALFSAICDDPQALLVYVAPPFATPDAALADWARRDAPNWRAPPGVDPARAARALAALRFGDAVDQMRMLHARAISGEAGPRVIVAPFRCPEGELSDDDRRALLRAGAARAAARPWLPDLLTALPDAPGCDAPALADA